MKIGENLIIQLRRAWAQAAISTLATIDAGKNAPINDHDDKRSRMRCF